MDDGTRQVLDRLNQMDLRAVVRRVGEVTAVSPLTVAVGGSDTPYVGVPQLASGGALIIGDVVLCLLADGKDLIVLGRIGPPAGWTAFVYSNGWRSFSGGTPGSPHATWGYAAWRREANGVIRLRGMIDKNGGNFVAAETILTLPVGARPTQQVLVAPKVSSSGGSVDVGRVDITTAGVMTLIQGAPANPVGFVSLDGVTFPTS